MGNIVDIKNGIQKYTSMMECILEIGSKFLGNLIYEKMKIKGFLEKL